LIVVDEYLALRSLVGALPPEFPDEPLALPTSAHWRLLQRIHAPGDGQLSRALRDLSPAALAVLRRPTPAVLEILDPRPLLDLAAAVSASYGGTGWLVAETLVAGLVNGGRLWFGSARNVGHRLREIANDLGIAVHVAT
jgi:hypothetical protein